MSNDSQQSAAALKEESYFRPTAWIIGRLPDFNRLVVAYMVGSKEHSDVRWVRDGWAFMVRHDDQDTIADGWSRNRYEAALKSLDAHTLKVIQWLELERPK